MTLAPYQDRIARPHYGRLNVAFADMHGQTVRPVEFDNDIFYNRVSPSRYAARVRVSPYQAHEID
ncbi:MAG: hypothetical protein ACYSVY_02960 [Planctomycetota bacterium]|jgi:prepilin-type processing-associated H-X9-DG protein